MNYNKLKLRDKCRTQGSEPRRSRNPANTWLRIASIPRDPEPMTQQIADTEEATTFLWTWIDKSRWIVRYNKRTRSWAGMPKGSSSFSVRAKTLVELEKLLR